MCAAKGEDWFNWGVEKLLSCHATSYLPPRKHVVLYIYPHDGKIVLIKHEISF